MVKMAQLDCLASGDPLGPLLFAIAWHRVVQRLPADLRLNVWYLDDGHLVGSPGALAKAFEIIVAEGAIMGITVNTDTIPPPHMGRPQKPIFPKGPRQGGGIWEGGPKCLICKDPFLGPGYPDMVYKGLCVFFVTHM